MITNEQTRQIWDQISSELTSYDGALTELVILYLPIAALPRAVHLAAHSLENTLVLNQEIGPSDYQDIPYSPALLSSLNLNHLLWLRGSLGPEDYLQVLFEPYPDEGNFDIELIFDNTTSFPKHHNRQQWYNTLQTYLNLIESLRMGYDESQVCISPEVTGPARSKEGIRFATFIEL